MNRALLLAAVLLPAAPAAAQQMGSMPGMDMSGSRPMTSSSRLPATHKSPKHSKGRHNGPVGKHRRGHPHRHHQPAGLGDTQGGMPGMPGMKMGAAASSAPQGHGAPMGAMSMGGAGQTSNGMQGASGMSGMQMNGEPGQAPQGRSASMPAMPMSGESHPSASMNGMGAMSGESGAGGMPGMQMSGMGAQGSSEAAIPQTPPPPPPTDHAADHYYDPTAMAAARAELRHEHGGEILSKVMADIAEYQARDGGAYRWSGQLWYGGDINRFVARTEGEGSRREGLDSAEVQALYSRAVGVYTDFQAGVRQDFSPRARTYLTAGAQTLFPYWFEAEGAVFLSTKGELLARAETYYDLRLTQRLILQPRVELNFAAQNSPQMRIGSGLTDAELGLRLRYEIRREFAPYIGVSYQQSVGRTADYLRSAGERPGYTTFVAGIRAFF